MGLENDSVNHLLTIYVKTIWLTIIMINQKKKAQALCSQKALRIRFGWRLEMITLTKLEMKNGLQIMAFREIIWTAI